jgi:dephospho-CoA kinase
MTPEKLKAILARQTPDAEKRARADFTIDTSLGIDAAQAEVTNIIHSLVDM